MTHFQRHFIKRNLAETVRWYASFKEKGTCDAEALQRVSLIINHLFMVGVANSSFTCGHDYISPNERALQPTLIPEFHCFVTFNHHNLLSRRKKEMRERFVFEDIWVVFPSVTHNLWKQFAAATKNE